MELVPIPKFANPTWLGFANLGIPNINFSFELPMFGLRRQLVYNS